MPSNNDLELQIHGCLRKKVKESLCWIRYNEGGREDIIVMTAEPFNLSSD
jgi:hypothetical protein